jgi:hypothetical protein
MSQKVSIERKRRQQKRRKQKALRQKRQAEGCPPPKKATLPNHKCIWKTPEEEEAVRRETIEETLKAFRPLLPPLLKELSKIEDPRNPNKIKHKLVVLLLYGLFSFVFQYASRREACRNMSRPVFFHHLQACFPELESLPHSDTLYRLLEQIDVNEIENVHVRLLQRLIRQKKFRKYLVNKRYLVAIDGTRKATRNHPVSEEYLHSKVNGGEDKKIYYISVLEAKLIFPNGIVLPLMSVFLDNTVDGVSTKQDCETKGFRRMAQKLKKAFPKLPITLLLDGLYADGPNIAMCRKNHWDFMIVLQDKDLPNVWKEANGLHRLDEQGKQTLEQTWKGRQQSFWWVNEIEHEYGLKGRLKQTVHVVVCEERWEEINDEGEIETKTSRHAWLSNRPLNKKNVDQRCNQMARSRWGLENDRLKEKHQGYEYEHVFAYDWNATRGYHYLMHLAHLFNELILHTEGCHEHVKEMGIQGFIDFWRETIGGNWMDQERIHQCRKQRHQLRLVC